MINPLDLTNKKILIIGATSNIGVETAIFLSKLGANIILAGRNELKLNEIFNKLEGENHKKFLLDLTNYESLEKLFKFSVEDNLKLSGMVYLAGISPVIPINDLNKDKLYNIMNINYFMFIEAVRNYSKKRYSCGGSIIGISSIASKQPEKCHTAYASSKAAMNMAVSCLSMELIKKNIRINTIMPGAIDNGKAIDNGINSGIEKQLLGLGKPDDISNIVAFLISDMSKFITGRNLYADGGRFL